MSVRVLTLYWHHGGGMRYAVERHLRALARGPHETVFLNGFWEVPRGVRALRFDAVVLHTLFLGLRWSEDFEAERRRFAWIRDAAPVKIAIPQDEYDHAEVLDEWLDELGVDVVLTNFEGDELRTLYPRLAGRARFRRVLTGYIDEEVAERCAAVPLPLEDRPYDVVYRGTRLPYWFGSHSQLKHRVAEAAEQAARELGLATDISTRIEDTIYGERWLEFLMSGRGVVGSESGTSVLDARGEIQARVKAMLADEPLLTFEEVDARMPAGWDAYAFFAISPRHLEAVVTKTCQVLVEGAYNGVLVANRHYLPLARDFSNAREVLARLRDLDLVRELTERAYEEVYLRGSYTYDEFAAQLAAELPAKPAPSVRRALTPLALRAGKLALRAELAARSRVRRYVGSRSSRSA